MKHNVFFKQDFEFSVEQREHLVELLKMEDETACDLLDRTENCVGTFLGRLQARQDNPGLSPAAARKLEVKIEREISKLLELLKNFDLITSNYQVRDALQKVAGLDKSYRLIDRLQDDLLNLRAALVICRNTAPATPRGRPVEGIDQSFVEELVRLFEKLSGHPASKSPQSIFYRFTKLVFVFADQPKSDVRELIGAVIGKPKKR